MTKEVQKWADQAMFQADPIDQDQGPQVTLLSCNSDPLGTIAAAALMYEGKSVQSLAEITDEQRRYYLGETAKTALAAPLEFVNFHFIISGVTRGFTHQMVRQRTATYTQESTRFAVKEDVPVGRPPSLDGTKEWREWFDECWQQLLPGEPLPYGAHYDPDRMVWVREWAEMHASKEQLWRRDWDRAVGAIQEIYNDLVNSGMPAEDARGLLPTNLLTRINYNTSLRGLLEHSGVRLCTQAQFEWRLVWTKIKEAIVEYGKDQSYACSENDANNYIGGINPGSGWRNDSCWQFEELSKIFKPICYQKGSCQFQADVDRACTIRDRVQAFASIHIASDKWDSPYVSDVGLPPIKDSEWMLDPTAARISQ